MLRKKQPGSLRPHSGRVPFWASGTSPQSFAVDDKAMAIFQPDILIGAQYETTQRRRFHLEPERVLMLAVLQDAVLCFQDHVAATCQRKQMLHRDAAEWIFSTDRSYLFSFENICDALGYDADYMRQGLARWKRLAQDQCGRKSQRQSIAGL
ncbi:MAG TPA: hypothetical protein VFV82_06830 [Candidatus Binatia bacterium]|nr:hypothetical protein [Candidatus Binatia bacterium]